MATSLSLYRSDAASRDSILARVEFLTMAAGSGR